MSTIAAVQKDLDALARQRLLYTIISVGAVLFLVIAGTMFAEARNAGSFVRGFTSFLNYPIDIISEAWEAGWKLPGRIAHFVPDLVETVNAAFLSTLLGAITALLVALGSSRNMVKNPLIFQTCRRAMDVMRSFPELVLAMIFLYLMGKSILPAVLAIWFIRLAPSASCFPKPSRIVTRVLSRGCNQLVVAGGSGFVLQSCRRYCR